MFQASGLVAKFVLVWFAPTSVLYALGVSTQTPGAMVYAEVFLATAPLNLTVALLASLFFLDPSKLNPISVALTFLLGGLVGNLILQANMTVDPVRLPGGFLTAPAEFTATYWNTFEPALFWASLATGVGLGWITANWIEGKAALVDDDSASGLDVGGRGADASLVSAALPEAKVELRWDATWQGCAGTVSLKSGYVARVVLFDTDRVGMNLGCLNPVVICAAYLAAIGDPVRAQDLARPDGTFLRVLPAHLERAASDSFGLRAQVCFGT